MLTVRDATMSRVHTYGTGVYVGQRTVPGEDKTVSVIHLDDGGIVYGHQCWWASPTVIRRRFRSAQMIPVRAPRDNGRWREDDDATA